MKRQVFDQTLSMDETTLLEGWNTKILFPLDTENENFESVTVKISWLLTAKKIKPLNHTFYKRENSSPVLTFSRLPKTKMISHKSVNKHCNHCIQNGTTWC